jgi:hypothetical protein
MSSKRKEPKSINDSMCQLILRLRREGRMTLDALRPDSQLRVLQYEAAQREQAQMRKEVKQ